MTLRSFGRAAVASGKQADAIRSGGNGATRKKIGKLQYVRIRSALTEAVSEKRRRTR